MAQLERGRGGEHRGDDEPDRRRELEPGVLAEQDVRRGQRVQREEAEARHECERDEEQPGVATPPRRLADCVPEAERDERRREHEPEVRDVALPAVVDAGCEKEEREERDRHDRAHDCESDERQSLA